MPVRKSIEFTAREEVAITDRYDAVFTAAGWIRFGGSHRASRSIPFCSRNTVRLLQYQGQFKGRMHTCFIYIPLANLFYEKRFTNALEKQNLIAMTPYGLTMDPEVNSVLRMCL